MLILYHLWVDLQGFNWKLRHSCTCSALLHISFKDRRSIQFTLLVQFNQSPSGTTLFHLVFLKAIYVYRHHDRHTQISCNIRKIQKSIHDFWRLFLCFSLFYLLAVFKLSLKYSFSWLTDLIKNTSLFNKKFD